VCHIQHHHQETTLHHQGPFEGTMQLYILMSGVSAVSACNQAFWQAFLSGVGGGGGGGGGVTEAPPLTNCRCGRENRIVGGDDTAKNEYPWQVGLLGSSWPGTPFCGGTLISDKDVLTAAHCTVGGGARYVVLGEHNVQNSNDGQQVYRVCGKKEHPNYKSGTEDNDFAILTLCDKVTFTTAVSPVCLPPDSSDQYSNKEAIVSGWGTLYSNGPQPSVLQDVTVKTMSNSQCTGSSTAYSSSDITSNMICAASPGKDSCQGDSGGPLITRDGNHYVLIGVVSWGFGCAQADAPGVYARVTSQLSWIQAQMTGASCEA